MAGRVLETCRNELGFSDAQVYEWIREWTGISPEVWARLVADAGDEAQCS